MAEHSIIRETLLDQQLPRALGVSHVEVRRITIAPSVTAGSHVHNGPVLGNIELGSVIFQVGDGRAAILRAGDVFHEPADTVITRFDATDEGVTFLGYFLLDDGRSPEITFVD